MAALIANRRRETATSSQRSGLRFPRAGIETAVGLVNDGVVMVEERSLEQPLPMPVSRSVPNEEVLMRKSLVTPGVMAMLGAAALLGAAPAVAGQTTTQLNISPQAQMSPSS